MRIAYWLTTSLVSCVAFDVFRHAAKRHAVQAPAWIQVPLILLAANLPLTFFTRSLAVLIWPFLADKVGWTEWYLQSLLVSLIYALVFGVSRAKPRSLEAPVIAHPLPLGDGVLCLQMEDHYVRVHTQAGSRLVLCSLNRAMTGLRGGIQVHRSWWVSRDAVQKVIEDGRNIRLQLRNGVEAPVARSKISQLRQAGWLS
jgi:hypothetical protein